MAKRKEPFNPLDKRNLGNSVANAILNEPMRELPPSEFEGIGIYALYYFGSHPLYPYISRYNIENIEGWPIYIGKAIARGGRKGVFDKVNKGRSLFNRLKKHSRTISEAKDLNLVDFRCRYLTVDSIWIPLGEQLLIDKFKPLWNTEIDGFGNNDPGSNRYSQQKSPWDILHPGRSWAEKLSPNMKLTDIETFKKSILEVQREQYLKLTG